MKLFMIPFAGGSCYSYKPLEQMFDSTISTQVLELPGRGKRMPEPFLETTSEAVEDICSQIVLENESDFAIFGHSMGAILAYLLTIRLNEKSARLPKHLFLAGHRAPTCRQRSPLLHNLPTKSLILELKKLEGIPEQLLEDPEAMDFFEPVIRSDFRIIENYYQEEIVKVPVPITLLMGSEDDIKNEEKEKWMDFTSDSFDMNEYKGGHFFIFQHKIQIAKTISETLKY